jgi:hypothetical protein
LVARRFRTGRGLKKLKSNFELQVRISHREGRQMIARSKRDAEGFAAYGPAS